MGRTQWDRTEMCLWACCRSIMCDDRRADRLATIKYIRLTLATGRRKWRCWRRQSRSSEQTENLNELKCFSIQILTLPWFPVLGSVSAINTAARDTDSKKKNTGWYITESSHSLAHFICPLIYLRCLPSTLALQLQSAVLLDSTWYGVVSKNMPWEIKFVLKMCKLRWINLRL